MRSDMPRRGRRVGKRSKLSAARLDALIAEALVDAYGDSEERTAFYTVLEGSLALPFTTKVLGVEVLVERLDLTADEQIVAVCRHGRTRQRIPTPGPAATRCPTAGSGMDRGVPTLGGRRGVNRDDPYPRCRIQLRPTARLRGESPVGDSPGQSRRVLSRHSIFIECGSGSNRRGMLFTSRRSCGIRGALKAYRTLMVWSLGSQSQCVPGLFPESASS